jgi:hypothetical protein
MEETNLDNSGIYVIDWNPDQIVFENIDSFNEYYLWNINNLNVVTTQRLTALFSVPGYKIVKGDGVITLKSTAKIIPYLSDRVTSLETENGPVVDPKIGGIIANSE